MLLLALAAATAQVSVAFGDGGAVIGSVQLAGGRRHAKQRAPAIEYLRRECGVGLDHLAAIAVGTGPGLFTGLRVGVTTAKVMAQALRIPVVGVPSLDLVANLLASDASDEQLATLIRLTERYCVVYQTLRSTPEITVSRSALA